ncbi:MFS transporter [Verrucosispora sp. WMMA2044]|uniref:MFS transporter n=1 Tax=Verrucosispora sp. WMMA2044 TaxID=3016419 RepID=UPI00248CB66B|nr:MFS transporter [Verrucosispora sp. WMMA2044]WBB50902.1 MFS transporter [Verrucosispora sp. WMMA2044]
MATEDEGRPRGARLVLLILLVAQVMATMDNSIVAVATKTIKDDLQTSGAVLQLILSGYTLMFAVLVVTGARLGGDVGHRRLFMIGLTGFTASSLLCGIAPTAGTLVAARLLQGAFGAMMVPQVLSVIQIVFTGSARARAIGLYSMVLALGVAAGQIAGGVIVSADVLGSGWRAAFLVNVPIGLALLAAAPRYLPGHTPSSRFRPDIVGILLLAVSMGAVVAPLVFGREQGWPAWALASIAAGTAGLVVFVRYELRLGARGGQPVLEIDALRPRGVKSGLLACCILNFAFAGVLFPLTLHVQNGLGYTPLQAGLMFIPYPVGFAAVSLTWTRLPKRFHRPLPVAGLLVFALALAALAVVVAGGWPIAVVSALLLLAGAGMAAGFSTLVEQTAATVGPRYAAALSALVSTGTLLASVVSVVVVGGVYLATAENDPSRSALGLSRSLWVDAGLLMLGFLLAYRTWRLSTRVSAGPAPNGDAAEQVEAVAAPGNAPPGEVEVEPATGPVEESSAPTGARSAPR